MCLQGPIVPCTHAMLAKWIPPNERSRMGAFVYAGENAVCKIQYCHTKDEESFLSVNNNHSVRLNKHEFPITCTWYKHFVSHRPIAGT